MEIQLDHLIKLVRKEKVALFIGAGFSLEANAPSAEDLRQAILDALESEDMKKEHEEDELSEIAQFFVEVVCGGSRAELIDLLKSKFQFEPVCMDDHNALSQIPHFHDIFTTNYDSLLEDSYPIEEREVIRKNDDCVNIDNKKVRIFKIHGDFTNQESIVITKQDYEDLRMLNKNALVWNEVKSIFTKKHVAFLGYSLSDDNIISMINFISNLVDRRQRQMFLIAPKISELKRQQLQKMKVTYIKATASEFLTKLKQGIDDNIGLDYKRHDVSDYTFNKYCEQHGFDLVVKPSARLNKHKDILAFSPLEGKELTHTVNFTVKNFPFELTPNIDFEKYGSYEKGSNAPFPAVPSVRFKEGEILDGTHRVNDLVMSRGFSQIILFPVVQSTELTIKVPCRNFLEKIPAQVYRLNATKFVLQFDCHIYTVKIVFAHNSCTADDLTGSISMDMKDTYTDNNLAIKWIDFICAFFNNEELHIKDMSSGASYVFRNNLRDINHNYYDYKKYYEYIRLIEMNSDVTFQTYNQCTEQNLTKAYHIASFLTHKPINADCKGVVEFSTDELMCGDEFVKDAEINEPICLVSTEDEEKQYTLNGHRFVIPYTHHVFFNCTVKYIKKEANGFVKAVFKYDGDSHQVYFSSEPARELFSNVNELKASK